mgnify:CR=1 FL=1
MSLAEANKRKRYYRIQLMYKYLQEYRLDVHFIDTVLCEFFCIGEATLYLAMKHEQMYNVRYPYEDLDKIWCDELVKAIRKPKKKPAATANQMTLL